VKHLGTDNTRDINRAMYDYLPQYYEDIREARAIIDVESAQFEQLYADIADVLAQVYVDTATWGLANWERICGIPNDSYKFTTFYRLAKLGVTFGDLEQFSWGEIETAYPKDLDERRSIIKSKLRGYGTVTKTFIQNVTEAYANGDVEVIEDYANYKIIIRFVNRYALPRDIDKIKEIIREIIPAHLDIEYITAHLLIRDIHEVKTLNQMEQLKLKEFAS
jgi:uncharacterized protein YmfQ (DUF2313 family)